MGDEVEEVGLDPGQVLGPTPGLPGHTGLLGRLAFLAGQIEDGGHQMFFHAGDIPGQLAEFTGKDGRIEIRGLAPGHPPGMAAQPGQGTGNPPAHGQAHQ